MRESILKVLSRERCPKSPRHGCVDSVSLLVVSSHEATSSNAGAFKQYCNACYTGSGGQHVESPITLIFDVNVALSQYIPATLSVDFRCPDSKISRLVCSHIQNIDMLTYHKEKCSFTFYQRHSFMLDQFRNIFSRLSCLTGALHLYILLKKYDCVKWVNFYLKSVKFLFLLSIELGDEFRLVNIVVLYIKVSSIVKTAV